MQKGHRLIVVRIDLVIADSVLGCDLDVRHLICRVVNALIIQVAIILESWKMLRQGLMQFDRARKPLSWLWFWLLFLAMSLLHSAQELLDGFRI
jgi:hypothetical protein